MWPLTCTIWTRFHSHLGLDCFQNNVLRGWWWWQWCWHVSSHPGVMMSCHRCHKLPARVESQPAQVHATITRRPWTALAHNNCSFAAASQIETWINSTNIQCSATLCAQCFTFCLIFVPMPVYLFAKIRIHFITLIFIFNLRKHLILLFLILRKCMFFKQ